VKEKFEPEPLKKNNNQQRASSASVYHPNNENKPQTKSYANQVQNLKRIKSELETIQEKKDENPDQ